MHTVGQTTRFYSTCRLSNAIQSTYYGQEGIRFIARHNFSRFRDRIFRSHHAHRQVMNREARIRSC